MNVAGDAAVIDICWPSIRKSISFTPSPLEHDAVTVTACPICSPAPFAGDVIITVGAVTPAGPNRFFKMVTSFWVAMLFSMHGCVALPPVPEHTTPNAFVFPVYKQSLPHGALSRNDSGVV